MEVIILYSWSILLLINLIIIQNPAEALHQLPALQSIVYQFCYYLTVSRTVDLNWLLNFGSAAQSAQFDNPDLSHEQKCLSKNRSWVWAEED